MKQLTTMKTSLNKDEFGKYLLLSELTKLPDPPNAIFALGNLELLNQKSLTVIGTRKPSEYGVQVISDLIILYSIYMWIWQSKSIIGILICRVICYIISIREY